MYHIQEIKHSFKMTSKETISRTFTHRLASTQWQHIQLHSLSEQFPTLVSSIHKERREMINYSQDYIVYKMLIYIHLLMRTYLQNSCPHLQSFSQRAMNGVPFGINAGISEWRFYGKEKNVQSSLSKH